MSEVKWIKIAVDIFNNEKILLIDDMPDADGIITIWFKLLCLAGKHNNHGVFLFREKIPYTEEMLSTIFDRNVNTVRLAINTFEQFGMIEIVDGVITIPNWDKYQKLDQLERKKEYMKDYMSERRKEQKLLVEACKTNGKTNSKTNGKTNSKTNGKTNSKTNCKTNVNILDKERELYKKERDNTERDLKPKAQNSQKNCEFGDLVDAYTSDDTLRKAITDFILHRKEIKKPIKTAKTLEYVLKKIEEFDENDRVSAIENSIANGWQGLFEPKKKSKVSGNVFDEIGKERGYW